MWVGSEQNISDRWHTLALAARYHICHFEQVT